MNEKLSKSLKNSPLVKANIAKLAERKRGKPQTEEHRRALSESAKGRVVSDETRALISAANKAAWARRKALIEFALAVLNNNPLA